MVYSQELYYQYQEPICYSKGGGNNLKLLSMSKEYEVDIAM